MSCIDTHMISYDPHSHFIFSFTQGTTWMILIHIAITMLIMHCVPKIPKYGRYLPASLVALIVGTLTF